MRNNKTFPKEWTKKLDEVKAQLHEFEQNPNKITENFERVKEQQEFTNIVFEGINKEYERKQKGIIKNRIIAVTTGIAKVFKK